MVIVSLEMHSILGAYLCSMDRSSQDSLFVASRFFLNYQATADVKYIVAVMLNTQIIYTHIHVLIADLSPPGENNSQTPAQVSTRILCG